MQNRRTIIPLLFLLACVGIAFGREPSAGGSADPAGTQPAQPKLSEKLSVTEHQMAVGGQVLQYRATAGYMPVKDEAGKEKGNFFFVAYEKTGDNETDPSLRPITFVFNGGPGAAAVWLHLGTAGPRRVAMANDLGEPPAPPHRLVENDYTWLVATDLVFIDPVGTGYSRAAPGEKPEQFFGVREDIASVADFIRLYTTKHERWLSPRFLAGESYGTTRAAGLSEFLADRYGISVNGIVLVSVVLDFQTIRTGGANDLPYPLFLPTYTATAWYHKKLPTDLQSDLQKALEQVEAFAFAEYLPALAQGSALDAGQRSAIARKLAHFTSLPVDFIEKSELRISPTAFRKKLLEDQQLIVGRFDSRMTAHDLSPAGSQPDFDPSFPGYLAAYSAAMNDYARRILRFESELPYEVLTDRVRPWSFGRPGEGYLSVASDLRSAMAKNPHLKVMFASGYYDLATPYFASDYTVNHLNVSKALRANVVQTYYAGGHMMYHERRSLEKLQADVVGFIRGAVGREE